MIPFFVHDPAGRILRFGTAPSETAALIQAAEPNETARIGEATEFDWWTGSTLTPRPMPPAPPTFVAGIEATWANLTEGTVITVISGVTNQIAGTIEIDSSGQTTFALAAGVWRLEVAENFPHLSTSFSVEVL